MKPNRLNRNRGAAILFIIFGLLFFIIVVRIITIQATGQAAGHNVAAEAAKQYLTTDVLTAERGNIYDANGDVVAEDVSSYSIYAVLSPTVTTDPKHPYHVVDARKTAEALSKYIDMSEDDIYTRLTKKGQFQVEFGSAGRDISYDTKQKIDKLKLPGINLKRDSKRFYPNGIFASHVIGYAQTVQGKNGQNYIYGKLGLEQSLNSELEGKNGKINYQSDKWGYIFPSSKQKVTKPEDGTDIYLTIDSKIQTFIEDAMNKVDEKYHPKSMVAVVADPKTGKILGMSQRPTFNPQTRDGLDKTWQNLNVESAIEPGSTMKTFTVAAAVDSGNWSATDKYESGKFKVKGSGYIKDHNYGMGWGKISYLEGIQRSSNVAVSKLLDRMGSDTYQTYLNRFHFGEKTGIDLPSEAKGSILYNYPIEQYTTTFGQGSTVTPIQLIQAETAIANNGKMMKPYVIDKKVNHKTGETTATQPEQVGTPVSADTAKEVRSILRSTVTGKNGTAKGYDLKGYEVAGKTGTAQLADSTTGKYMTGWDNYIFSFLGMAPAKNPKLIVYVAVKQPQLDEKTFESGSLPVEEVFNPVMQNSLQYLNIKPTGTQAAKAITLSDLSGMSVSEAKATLKSQGLDAISVGKGNEVTDQLPTKNTAVLVGEKVILKTDSTAKIPNMKNWSKRDVMKVASILNLRLSTTGSGYAINQSISSGTTVKKNDALSVSFDSQANILKKNNNKEKSSSDTPKDQ